MAKFIGGDQQHVRGTLSYGSSDLPPVGPTAGSATFGLARHSYSTVVHYCGSFPFMLEEMGLAKRAWLPDHKSMTIYGRRYLYLTVADGLPPSKRCTVLQDLTFRAR